MAASPRFVWMDLEMTGLDPERCVIVAIAAIITGPDLEPLAEIERIVWQPEEALGRMSPFVRDMHTKNGLLDQIRASSTGLEDAEREIMSVITQHCRYREGMLAGNSIHQDRRFLSKHMPAIEGYLHYRQLDVSSLKLLAQTWYPGQLDFRKAKAHTALGDIRESIAELKFYREKMLIPAL
ncbi:MAG: oligoribonuclease [Polyangiaceae bacterium]